MQWFHILFLFVARSIFAENPPQCFTHGDCLTPGQFCAWSTCFGETGESYSCGSCRPCEKCGCDKDSTDFSCPAISCPIQPINGVRFLQGRFNSRSSLPEAPDYDCVRQFEVIGNMFSISQLPIYSLHPSTTATLNEADIPFSDCPSYTRSGVIDGPQVQMNGQIKFNATISSEGDPHVLKKG
jgi:hypothetical protein